ncbi:MAG: branched-chain amino acid ABC transporter permease [Chthonomonas sp.]|nr:branched-chain amino acid ABC transporter permease [Chthonomonas sp.]
MRANFLPVRLISIVLGIALALGIQVLGKSMFGGGYLYTLLAYCGIYVTLAVSLNLINGITGQFSIGHAGFWMVGAYTSGTLGLLVWPHMASLPLFTKVVLSMLAGGITSALMGLIVGLPSLRLRGDYLALVTLGFGEIIRIVAQNLDLYNRSSGFNVTPTTRDYVWLIWLLAFVTIAVCRNLLQNAQGLAFIAVREDEVAANAMGVNTTRIKVGAFVLGSMFAGMAGSLFANFDGFLTPDKFKMDISFLILTMVVLGGTGSITGSVVAAIVLYIIPEQLRNLGQVPVGAVLGAALSIVICVSVIRWLMEHVHEKRARWVGLTVLGGVLLTFIGGKLSMIPALAKTIDGNSLRMPILAITLIVVMLLRPQGVFGHKEFSLGHLFGGKADEVAA